MNQWMRVAVTSNWKRHLRQLEDLMTTAEAILRDAFPAIGTAQQDVEALVRKHAGTVFRALRARRTTYQPRPEMGTVEISPDY